MHSSKLFLWTFINLSSTASYASPVLPIAKTTNLTNTTTLRLYNTVAQQKKAMDPPLPILEIGLHHILSQMQV